MTSAVPRTVRAAAGMIARVLVTGPAGMLGSSVVPWLVARGHQVRVPVHNTQAGPLSSVELVRGDVRPGAGLAEWLGGN